MVEWVLLWDVWYLFLSTSRKSSENSSEYQLQWTSEEIEGAILIKSQGRPYSVFASFLFTSWVPSLFPSRNWVYSIKSKEKERKHSLGDKSLFSSTQRSRSTVVKGRSSQLVKTVAPVLAIYGTVTTHSPMGHTIDFIQIHVLSLEFM